MVFVSLLLHLALLLDGLVFGSLFCHSLHLMPSGQYPSAITLVIMVSGMASLHPTTPSDLQFRTTCAAIILRRCSLEKDLTLFTMSESVSPLFSVCVFEVHHHRLHCFSTSEPPFACRPLVMPITSSSCRVCANLAMAAIRSPRILGSARGLFQVPPRLHGILTLSGVANCRFEDFRAIATAAVAVPSELLPSVVLFPFVLVSSSIAIWRADRVQDHI